MITNNQKTNKILVAMSGGVDSSVAALLLIEQGWQVEGIFMKNWDEDDNSNYCTAKEDFNDAKSIADKLNIKLHVVNFAAEYWDHVFEHFLKMLRTGVTPNPDILCNKYIKFKALLDYAKHLGYQSIATGHYARIKNDNKTSSLHKGIDLKKDQTYFLYAVENQTLSKIIFPVGGLHKTKVRQIAQQHNFCNTFKKDSTGICFIGERPFQQFLSKYLPAEPGNIVTLEGETVGQHQGVFYYTIGQRKGLKIGGIADKPHEPWYVIQKDLAKNELIVVQGSNHSALYNDTLIAINLNWLIAKPTLPLTCHAKTRYGQLEQPCTIYPSTSPPVLNSDTNSETIKVIFKQPQWAITPGQSVVFYIQDQCIGGGIITDKN